MSDKSLLPGFDIKLPAPLPVDGRMSDRKVDAISSIPAILGIVAAGWVFWRALTNTSTAPIMGVSPGSFFALSFLALGALGILVCSVLSHWQPIEGYKKRTAQLRQSAWEAVAHPLVDAQLRSMREAKMPLKFAAFHGDNYLVEFEYNGRVVRSPIPWANVIEDIIDTGVPYVQFLDPHCEDDPKFWYFRYSRALQPIPKLFMWGNKVRLAVTATVGPDPVSSAALIK